ncbi:phytoene/squalene synthase family protein [Aureimonas jatrophae]|uniref:Phytoene synthase n=1 Tax=Aureimonas jatrophae TaxID=1166073 RepID=A0A1H0DQ75_9HYPH|nr:phytoene/squalene synthase family protein [Aureimonas jatrophae]MBB3952012.1 phytoene synthase [Aureimonas jatrophae]SDN72131.1 phytoene synthase [Aureimonas jatrophae]
MSRAAAVDTGAFAERSIAKGSKSFAAAARLFDAATRGDVVRLYAWCRHCDDVADGQEGGHLTGARPEVAIAERVAGLRRDTDRALAGDTAGLDPSFQALAEVARRHALPPALFHEHLKGFELDAGGRRYETLDELLGYCWHVAGVVGVLMARVMGVTDEAVLDRACDLGLAFQLTNIARDVVEDAGEGRVYVPLAWLREEGIAPADLAQPAHAAAVARLRRRLVEAAEPYYASARQGVDRLPRRSAWAIGTAERVYRRIGLKLVAAGEAAHGQRVSTGTGEKAAAILGGGWGAVRFRAYGEEPRDPALWRRPAI